MNEIYTVEIPGVQGKGSKTVVPTAAGPRLVDDNRSGLRTWEGIAHVLLSRGGPLAPLEGACRVVIAAFVRRPKAHYRGKSGALRADAPARPACGRDLDKVARAVLDCLTRARWIGDDRQVAALHVTRDYSDVERTCVAVQAMEGA